MKEMGAQSLFDRVGRAVTDFLLPPRCPACGTRIMSHGHMCGNCWSQLAPIAKPYCAQCGLPFEFDPGEDAICGACMKEPPEFDWARAAVSYEDMGKHLILGLKHGRSGAGLPAIASMMARLVPAGQAVEMILPVPLHRSRLFRRRFNQSQLIASALAKRLDIECDPFLLERWRATPSQGHLDRKQRQRNVKGAFRVRPGREGRLEGKKIVLVDDVLTTGATASACAKALRRAGAVEVGVLAFARVGKPVRG